jgi:phospholipid/cholesterol/gamma-HCH transport system substrate-binding protein
VQGLVAGNNVRFSGINVGTVKKIAFIEDSVIEVRMSIEKRMQSIIKKNAIASIGTEGIVGNRVINIIPSANLSELAVSGDLLVSKKPVNIDEMLETLNKTNTDIGVIASQLKNTVQNINNSNALWMLLNDRSIPKNIRASVLNVQSATAKANRTIGDLQLIVSDIKNGKGSIGAILTDTSFAMNLNAAIMKINGVGDQINLLTADINNAVHGIERDINTGPGTANALLKDSMLVRKLNVSLDNIQKGTDGFNQNMEALKQNFLFRGYFRKLQRQKEKEQKETGASN